MDWKNFWERVKDFFIDRSESLNTLAVNTFLVYIILTYYGHPHGTHTALFSIAVTIYGVSVLEWLQTQTEKIKVWR